MHDGALPDAVVVQRFHPYEDLIHLQENLREHIIVLTVQSFMEANALLTFEKTSIEHFAPYRPGQRQMIKELNQGLFTVHIPLGCTPLVSNNTAILQIMHT